MSSLGVIKVQEERYQMEEWMRYNVVAMLYYLKFNKMKTYQKIRHDRQQSTFSVMTMDRKVPRYFLE